MRKLVLSGMVAALLIASAVPDASACRGRRHRACTCPCECAPCAAPSPAAKSIYRVSVLQASCAGGNGTYGAPDTSITAVYFQDTNNAKYQCKFSYANGTWQTTGVPALQKGTYKLCAVGNVTGAVCSGSFPCP
jgi:hypothetical protein